MFTVKRAATAALALAALIGLGALVPNSSPTADPVLVSAEADPVTWKIRERIAKIAIEERNKPEDPPGSNNYPKHYQLNNNIVRPAEWCGVFVNWAWSQGGASKIPQMKAPKDKKGKVKHKEQGHYATYWQKWAKNTKRWKSTPSLGDAVVFGNYPDGKGHVALVVDVKFDKKGKATHVKTVEGNVGQKVTYFDKWRKISDIRGGEGKRKVSGFVSPV